VSDPAESSSKTLEPIELEDARIPLPDPEADQRPTIPTPPPVWLVAVEDVRLPTIAGLESKLAAFYHSLLKLEPEDERTFRAENCRIRFQMVDKPIERIDFRALTVEVPSLIDLEKTLVELELEYERIKGLQPGERSILIYDPAGNLVQVNERRELI
jgi:hypothetical protein